MITRKASPFQDVKTNWIDIIFIVLKLSILDCLCHANKEDDHNRAVAWHALWLLFYFASVRST